MSVPSVLFDAPGPKARRISLVSSIVTGILILGGLTWIALTLAAPRESGGITTNPTVWPNPSPTLREASACPIGTPLMPERSASATNGEV